MRWIVKRRRRRRINLKIIIESIKESLLSLKGLRVCLRRILKWKYAWRSKIWWSTSLKKIIMVIWESILTVATIESLYHSDVELDYKTPHLLIKGATKAFLLTSKISQSNILDLSTPAQARILLQMKFKDLKYLNWKLKTLNLQVTILNL